MGRHVKSEKAQILKQRMKERDNTNDFAHIKTISKY